MAAESDVVRPSCPHCGGSLLSVGGREVAVVESEFSRRHAYWCHAGCRGPELDGTFEFFECPVCGSHDTVTAPGGDGVEELECNACGTITSVQMVPPAG